MADVSVRVGLVCESYVLWGSHLHVTDVSVGVGLVCESCVLWVAMYVTVVTLLV